MNLYIQIKDGQPFEHPIFEDNFIEAFPNVDINNLPLEFAKFRRIPIEECGLTNDDPLKKLVMTNYRLSDDGFWEDVWEIVNKDNEEVQNYEQYQNEKKLYVATVKLENLKNKANEIYASLVNESEKQAWDTYFSIMSFEDPVSHDITIPKYPIKNEQGKYVPNLDENGNWVTRVLHDGQ
jgi:hypothetical protein